MWEDVALAPADCDLELAVIDAEGAHALVFACRRVAGGWIDAASKRRIDIRPTHWRRWPE
jgi:hypothetical protein